MSFLKKYLGLSIVLLLSFWAVRSFFLPGFFPMHDDTQVVRVAQMAKALTDGHFPVRWVKDLGYGFGYPLFNFYAPLPYYVGGLINSLGIDALMSTKVMMVIGILLSGIFMYLLVREFWGEIGAVVSGLFYVYAPYHAVDIYVRGAVGEFWAMAFLPLLFYGMWKVYRVPRWRWVIVGSLGLAGVVLSHNLTVMMVAPLLLIAALLASLKLWRSGLHSSIFYLLSSIFLGLGISAFYWLPAIAEMGYTNILSQIGGGADFRDHFVCLTQLWDSPWGFGGSAPGCIDGLSFKIGKLHILLSVVSFVVALTLWRKACKEAIIVLLATAYLLLLTFMSLEISRQVWEAIPFLAFVQYPWRFLTIVSFASALLSGGAVFLVKKKKSRLLSGVALILLLLYSNGKLFQPQTVFPRTEADYTNERHIKWTTSKISDEYMPRNFEKPTAATDIVRQRVARGEILREKTQELSFLIDQVAKERVLVRIAPFPSWKASIDGQSVESKAEKTGIAITVPKGRHRVDMSFVSTPIEKVANMVSIVSFFVLIGGILVISPIVKTRLPL